MAARWTDLGNAAGSRDVGVTRIEIDPGKWSTPLHRQTAEEEIFFVLAGSGVSLQRRSRDVACEVRAGDCLVHRADAESHTLRAGPHGLDVLAFGTRVRTEIGHLPRAGVAWIGRSWTDVGGGNHPWEREVEAGEPELPKLRERPPNVVNVADVAGEDGGTWKRLGREGGAQLTGLNWGRLEPGEEGFPHCHSVEEEIYVVLSGDGEVALWPSPQLARHGRAVERHAVRAGHVVAFPPGGAVAHGIKAGPDGMTALFYGTRSAADIAYYPRSNKIFFRGLGLIGRLEDLDYADGEPR
jgi:uncharacterized cupin superfamily protein